jgi:Carboxypeptidase regulatory-like domain
MRRLIVVVCSLLVAVEMLNAQVPSTRRPAAPARSAAAATLPARRVVLYKNGIGYFEHIGKVRDNQAITIDFTSAQLDDALKSLTALDLGNGRVSGIAYNSDAPMNQRLGLLRLPVSERTTLSELLGALRGARLEVRVGERLVSGRLLGIERRAIGNGPTQSTRDEISLVSDAGDIRTIDLNPSVSIRLAERESAEQVATYLGFLASTRAPDRRRITIATAGVGERDLLVSYISEVPIWKTTYRIVMPPDGEQPLLQGWAIIDNTTGADWTDVDLSLVAGAPQSFIQQLSQPRYSRRPVVQPPQGALLTPQTHDPTLITGVGRLRGSVRDQSSGALPGASVRVLDPQLRTVAQTTPNATGSYAIDGLAPGTYRVEVALAGFQTVTSEVSIGSTGESVHDAVMRVGSVAETLTVTGEAPAAGSGLGLRGGSAGGVAGGFAQAPPRPDQAAIARSLADLQVAAASRELTDLFEYRLTNSISVRQNQSALVPIINVPASIERVSLWNGRVGTQPLRALWLTNSSDVTLDAGIFSVIDGGAFAGEGLIEPLKPQEKRLLSYAVDLGLQIDARQGDERRMISRITLQRGVVIEHREQRTRRVYTIRNNDTTDRTVVVEHPVRPGWTLASETPAETSSTAYRFKVAAPAKQTTTLVVEERQPLESKHEVTSMTDDQVAVLVRDSGSAILKQAFTPILAKKAAIAALSARLADRQGEIEQISQDEARVRENLIALKSTSDEKRLVKRYASQLTDWEDRIVTLRRERTDLDRQRQQEQTELQQLIGQLSLSIETGSEPSRTSGEARLPTVER